MEMNNSDIITINRETKIYLLNILKRGVISKSDIETLSKITGIKSITIEIIDRREQVEQSSITR